MLIETLDIWLERGTRAVCVTDWVGRLAVDLIDEVSRFRHGARQCRRGNGRVLVEILFVLKRVASLIVRIAVDYTAVAASDLR